MPDRSTSHGRQSPGKSKLSATATLPDLFAYDGEASNDGDAFKVYKHLRDDSDPATKNARAYVRRIWRRFNELGLPDKNFARHFPHECPQRIWEMHWS